MQPLPARLIFPCVMNSGCTNPFQRGQTPIQCPDFVSTPLFFPDPPIYPVPSPTALLIAFLCRAPRIFFGQRIRGYWKFSLSTRIYIRFNCYEAAAILIRVTTTRVTVATHSLPSYIIHDFLILPKMFHFLSRTFWQYFLLNVPNFTIFNKRIFF